MKEIENSDNLKNSIDIYGRDLKQFFDHSLNLDKSARGWFREYGPEYFPEGFTSADAGFPLHKCQINSIKLSITEGYQRLTCPDAQKAFIRKTVSEIEMGVLDILTEEGVPAVNQSLLNYYVKQLRYLKEYTLQLANVEYPSVMGSKRKGGRKRGYNTYKTVFRDSNKGEKLKSILITNEIINKDTFVWQWEATAVIALVKALAKGALVKEKDELPLARILCSEFGITITSKGLPAVAENNLSFDQSMVSKYGNNTRMNEFENIVSRL